PCIGDRRRRMSLSPPYSEQAAAPPGAALAAGERSGEGQVSSGVSRPAGGLLSRVTIRTRLIVLSSALLAILVATNVYLTRQLANASSLRRHWRLACRRS